MVIPSILYINCIASRLICKGLKYSDTDIKYVAENYAIEKALRWMLKQPGVCDVLSVEMIEDFKKYMEDSKV